MGILDGDSVVPRVDLHVESPRSVHRRHDSQIGAFASRNCRPMIPE
jgi:hypothetical protein